MTIDYKVDDIVTLKDGRKATILNIVENANKPTKYSIQIEGTDSTIYQELKDFKTESDTNDLATTFKNKLSGVEEFLQKHKNNTDTIELLYKDEVEPTNHSKDYISAIKANTHKIVLLSSDCFNFKDNQLKKAYPELMILDLSTIRGDYNKLGTIKVVEVFGIQLVLGYTHYNNSDTTDYIAFAMICKKLNNLNVANDEILICMEVNEVMIRILDNELNKYKIC
jgi:hypothetical protein